MAVHAHEQGAVNTRLLPVLTDGLGHGQNMLFIKAAFQRATAMTGGAKTDPFRVPPYIRAQGEIGGDQLRNID